MLYSQSGEKYSVNGNYLGAPDILGSKNYAPLNFATNSTIRALFTADGNFESWYDSYFKKNVTVDSTITAWEIYAMYRLSVYGDVVVTGIMKSAKLILTDGNITSMTGTINFGSNNLTTTGNVTAGSFNSPSFAGNSRAMLATDTAGNIIRKEYSGNPNEVLTGDGNWSNLSQSTGWQWVDTNLVSTAAQVVVANNLAVGGKISVGQIKVISNGSNKDTLHTEKELVIITDSKNISLEADTVKIPRLLDSKRMETDTLNSKKINASKIYVAGDITSTGTVYTGNLYVANDVMLPLFTGTKNLLLTDSTGKVSPLGISSTSNKVLLSNGTWGAVPIPQNYWQMQGDDIYTLTPGNIGLGMNNPAYKLDVAGTVRISEDLLVGGGIIISEKVNATRELKSASLRADSIIMDNTKAFYGESRFADSVKIQSKLRVDGNIDAGGDLRSSGSLIFGGDKTLGFRPAANGFPDIIYFKSGPIIEPQLSPCFNPNVTIFQQEGIFRSYGDNVDGNTNNMYVGFDGADGVIDIGRLVMFPATIEPKLLINKFCGKDVHVCTGTNGGNIQLTGTLGKVGIGTQPDANSPKLNVNGNVRIADLTPPTGTYNVVVADGTGLLGTKATSEIGDNLGDHTATGNIIMNTYCLSSDGSNNGIFFSSDNKVGIGTDQNLTEKLNVNGYGKFYGTGSGGNTGSTTIGFNGMNGYLNTYGGGLLINYYSGKDVVVGGDNVYGASTGNFFANHNAYLAAIDGNVGIGTSSPAQDSKLHIREMSGTPVYATVQNDNGSVKMGFRLSRGTIDSESSNSSYGELLLNCFTGKDVVIGGNPGFGINSGDLFANHNAYLAAIDGKVRIGSNQPATTKLDIDGDVRISVLTTPTGTYNVVVADGTGLLGTKTAIEIGDNLGDHTATGNIIMNTYCLSSDGSNNGIFFSSDNKVGIGSDQNLTEKLNVNGYGKFYGTGSGGNTGSTTIGFNGMNGYLNTYGGGLLINYYSGKDVVVGGDNVYGASTGNFFANHNAYLAAIDGNVGIGTTLSNIPSQYSDYRLFVNGKILCEKITVITDVGADYVFDNDYKLMPLYEIEKFINENKHLPEVSSIDEMKKNGIDLKELNILLLKKVEELTLYLINLQKQVDDLKSENSILFLNK